MWDGRGGSPHIQICGHQQSPVNPRLVAGEASLRRGILRGLLSDAAGLAMDSASPSSPLGRAQHEFEPGQPAGAGLFYSPRCHSGDSGIKSVVKRSKQPASNFACAVPLGQLWPHPAAPVRQSPTWQLTRGTPKKSSSRCPPRSAMWEVTNPGKEGTLKIPNLRLPFNKGSSAAIRGDVTKAWGHFELSAKLPHRNLCH